MKYYITFYSADGRFFSSRWAKADSIDDLLFDLRPYFKRFPDHIASIYDENDRQFFSTKDYRDRPI